RHPGVSYVRQPIFRTFSLNPMLRVRRLIRLPWTKWGAATAGGISKLSLGAVYFWPLPGSLDGELRGTSSLVDVRGRQLAEVASADARVQLPRELHDLGPWLPKVTVALEDHRIYDHGAIDFRGIGAAIFRD